MLRTRQYSPLWVIRQVPPFVMEVLRGLMTDVCMAQALNQALLKEGFSGTYH